MPAIVLSASTSASSSAMSSPSRKTPRASVEITIASRNPSAITPNVRHQRPRTRVYERRSASGPRRPSTSSTGSANTHAMYSQMPGSSSASAPSATPPT